MLGFVAAVLFTIAFLINATSAITSAVFSPTSLLLAGLAVLAFHFAGVDTKWSCPGAGLAANRRSQDSHPTPPQGNLGFGGSNANRNGAGPYMAGHWCHSRRPAALLRVWHELR
jgi:hypothetical protein